MRAYLNELLGMVRVVDLSIQGDLKYNVYNSITELGARRATYVEVATRLADILWSWVPEGTPVLVRDNETHGWCKAKFKSFNKKTLDFTVESNVGLPAQYKYCILEESNEHSHQ